MIDIELYGADFGIIKIVKLPFAPNIGELISIENEDYFKYYCVIERWIRLDAKNAAIVCLRLALKD